MRGRSEAIFWVSLSGFFAAINIAALATGDGSWVNALAVVLNALAFSVWVTEL